MNAAQMYNEWEILYEAIASGDAPGYEPYEVSVLLSEAQEQVLKEVVASGAERNDIRSLVIGPFIKVDTITPGASSSSTYANTLYFDQSTSDYWLIVNERLRQTPGSSTVEVKPVTHAFWDANKNNPYKQPSSTKYFWRLLENASGSSRFLITGPTEINTYYIFYLDKPDPIIVPGVDNGTTIDGTEVNAGIATSGLGCAYNSVIHRDIIRKAAENAAAYVKDTESFQLLKAGYTRE